eukprot:XP_001694140.1 predicted protein [Chlamydomonas reinhardtii]
MALCGEGTAVSTATDEWACLLAREQFKFYPGPNCRRAMSSVKLQLSDGSTQTRGSIYYEDSGDRFIGKITTLPFNLQNANGAVLCWTLTAPCPTLFEFTHPATRDKGLFEIALYDHKVFLAKAAPFDMARARCGRGGGVLASLPSASEWQSVEAQLQTANIYRDGATRAVLWIGVDPVSLGVWLDGTTAGMCYAANCPSNGQPCTWDALPCDSTAVDGFICEIDTNAVSYALGVPETGSTYVYSNTTIFSRSAATFCGRLGGLLFSANTQDEFNRVVAPIVNGQVPVNTNRNPNGSGPGRYRYWLGIADAEATKWVDGSDVTFSRFTETGAPGCYDIDCPAGPGASASLTPADCVWELATGCLRLYNFICEIPGVLEGPSGPL